MQAHAVASPDVGSVEDQASGGRAKRTFLKRGEGVQKRVFGSQIRKARGPSLATSGGQASSASGGQVEDDVASDQKPAGRCLQSDEAAVEQPWDQPQGENEPEEHGELPAQSAHMPLQEGYNAPAAGTWQHTLAARHHIQIVGV
jgi:hypothetical protein